MLLGDDGVAVIRKNDHEEPIETRLFQAPLGYQMLRYSMPRTGSRLY